MAVHTRRQQRRKRRKMRNYGPRMTRKEKKDLSAERNIASFPDACALIPSGLPEFMADCLHRKFSFQGKNGGPVPVGLPEVSMSVDGTNSLKTEMRCWLDYGGVQALGSWTMTTSLGHIPFTYTDQARRTRLCETIKRQMDSMSSAFRRSVPAFYPSFKHGDPEFEGQFDAVTYNGFDQRMKLKDAKKLLYQLTCAPDGKPGTRNSMVTELTRQAGDRLSQRISALQAEPPPEGMFAPLGVRDVTCTFGTIANDMRSWMRVDALILYPPETDGDSSAPETSGLSIRVKEPFQIPLRFGVMRTPEEGRDLLRKCLTEALSAILDRLAAAVSYRGTKPAAPEPEEQSPETEHSPEPLPEAGKDAAAEGEAPPKRKRKKKERSPEEKLIADYRLNSPHQRHVLVAEADISRSDAMRIFSMSTAERLFKNKLIEIFKPRIDKLCEDEEYCKQRKKYGEIKKELGDVTKGSEEYEKLDAKRKAVGDVLQQMQETARVTKDLLIQEHQRIRLQYPLPSVLALTAAEAVWKAIDSVLYGDGRTIHFKRYGTYPVLRAKQPDGEIIFRVVDGKLQFSMHLMPVHDERRAVEVSLREEARKSKRLTCLEIIRKKQANGEALTDEEAALLTDPDALPKLTKEEKNAIRAERNRTCWETFTFGLVDKPDDRFLNDELSRVITFLQTPGMELEAARKWKTTKVAQNTFRPCYAALSCQKIRGKYRVFVHITIDGTPCPKYKKDGSPRHIYGQGRVGIDLGTQSIATVSDERVRLENLAKRSGKSTLASEDKVRAINQYTDRSRRMTNPDNYNEDRTCKKGRQTWKYSKSAKKAMEYVRNLERKNACSRKYAINQTAWEIRAEADIAITEPNCVKAWAATGKAKRKREREEAARKAAAAQNAGTAPDQTQDGAAQTAAPRKKGHRRKATNKNRCPGAMAEKLKQVFESTGGLYIKVEKMFRASQYDHETGKYIKKKLSQRWHILGKSLKEIQRDIYSAFLLYCSDNAHEAPDQDRCFDKFDEFFARHKDVIKNIVESHLTVCNSGIKA